MANFRTRARAVDMLGRQQIAGIQNAISELFKNAHDAYARHASVDYFENHGSNGEGFIVVRDDGIGMTLNDFKEKWLVLGTESKVELGKSQKYRPPDMEERPITGEKGIGRLAIALLGKQVLILTRAIREEGSQDLVMALIHWGFFEQLGLNLEEIEIPIDIFPGGTLPGMEEVLLLRNQLIQCIEKISNKYPNIDLSEMMKEVSEFSPDPAFLDDFFSSRDSQQLSLIGEGTGTHFIIGPSNPILKIEIDTEIKEGDYSFRKQLLGFCDNVFGEKVNSTIKTSFRRWQPGDLIGEDLLDPNTFFTKDELMKKSDHLLNGSIDSYGQFKGALRVYEEEYADLLIPWSGNRGNPTKCGPFKVVFGYLMGRSSESRLSPEEYEKLNSKLLNLGSIYVYRDGIRILPYGDTSVDWLDIEQRRNRGAGHYFFSHRRMFGAVILTRHDNRLLQEKAGREGFQKNEAFGQVREILINLLVQLAAEFFRKGGSNTELFEKTQAEARRRSESLERQQKRATEKRKKLEISMEAFMRETNQGIPVAAVANIRKLTQARMESASKISDQDKAAKTLIRAEQDAVSQLNELRAKYLIKRPPGVALTKKLAQDWDEYQLEKSRLDLEVFNPFEEEIRRTLGQVAKHAKIYIDQRKRLEESIEILADERKKKLADASKQANATAIDARQTVLSITEKARIALDQTIRSIQSDLNRTDLSHLPSEEIDRMRRKWEDELTEIEGRHRDALMAARDMLASLAENLRSSDGNEPAQIMEALEQRMISLEEQADEDFEMVQLGLAVAIINHEFSASITRVRRSIQELGQISRKAEGLRPLYESIRTNFEHLDGHLNLFTPLQRRLYRDAQPISGKSIRNYVSDLFSNRFDRHKVALDCTDAFLASQVECYPSTIYPAIINLIDNALFWLASIVGDRTIRLNAEDGAFIISNNGPGIEERDRLRIFERGYSRKPGGRGLGLFISAKALQAENMTLSLDTPSIGFNVAFRISIPQFTFIPKSLS